MVLWYYGTIILCTIIHYSTMYYGTIVLYVPITIYTYSTIDTMVLWYYVLCTCTIVL